MLVDRQTPTDLFLAGNPRNKNHGWDALSEAMESGARLRKLRVSVNSYDDADRLGCIRFIRGMASQPHSKEFGLSWNWPKATSGVVPDGDVLECLISAVGSFRFLEKLRFEWIERALRLDDWKDALLAAAKHHESLVEINVDRIYEGDFQNWLKFYNLRNRVNRALLSSARGLWGDMLFQLHQCLWRSVGLSNVFLAFKTHPKLSETAGCSRYTKRRRAEEEDTDKKPE